MDNEPITIEWLEWYGDAWRAYESYKKEKAAIESRLGICGIDYSKEHNSSNKKRLSNQEVFVLKLERLNKEIAECESILFPAKEKLITQIKRIKKANWRKVLILYYVEKWKLKDIAQDCFWYENDYEIKQDIYLDTVKRWKREAIHQLEEVSKKPFIEITQLTLEEAK